MKNSFKLKKKIKNNFHVEKIKSFFRLCVYTYMSEELYYID